MCTLPSLSNVQGDGQHQGKEQRPLAGAQEGETPPHAAPRPLQPNARQHVTDHVAKVRAQPPQFGSEARLGGRRRLKEQHIARQHPLHGTDNDEHELGWPYGIKFLDVQPSQKP